MKFLGHYLSGGAAGELENELLRAQKEVHLLPNRKHEAGGQHDQAQRRLDEATKKEAPKWLVPQRNASRKPDIIS